jgi:predicted nucleic acid-binding protein
VSWVVSDTTPLNYLILIGHVDVLPNLFGKLLIPPAVIREMRHPKAPAAVAVWTSRLPAWIEVKAPQIDLRLGIGAGEDEAISLAVELGAALLLDDKKARAAAEGRGLLTIGTIAILDLADETGLLDFDQAISQLRMTTFHVEDALLQPVLAKVRARKIR